MCRLVDFDTYLGEIAQQLDIHIDPSADSVIDHLNNICKDNKKCSANDEMKAYLKVKKTYKKFQSRFFMNLVWFRKRYLHFVTNKIWLYVNEMDVTS